MGAKVSVCCTVLDQSAWLNEMIATVYAQTFTDWELVLVDDGSTEDIKAVVDSYNDARIKLHRFDVNKGTVAGINYAFRHAEGKYVQPLAADEFIEPNKLLWQVGYLDEHPDIDCIWGLPGRGAVGERPEWEQYALRAHNRSRESWIKTLLMLDNIPIGGAGALWRRKVFDSIGYFDPETNKCSDLEWFVRFFQKHEGRIMPYRWAWSRPESDPVPTPAKAEAFAKELNYVRAKHAMTPFAKEENPLVTVGIPVYNMAHWVGDTIRSIQAQTYKNIEILVLDDKSTDNIVEVVSQFTEESRLRFYQFDENRGVHTVCNQLLAYAKGSFFTTVAADDTISPTLIEECLAEFREHQFCEYVSTQTDFMGADGKPMTGDHPFMNIAKPINTAREQFLAQLYYGNVYFGVGLYRTRAAREVGGWDTEAGVLGDYDMYLKLLQRENIRVIPKPLTHTRIHKSNRSLLDVEGTKKLKRDYAKIKRRYYAPRMKVIIATPFYEMKGFSPYIVSMTQTIKLLTLMGIEHEFWEVSGDSYVERAKNTICNKFLEDPEATHLFMIDSDMMWDPHGFLKMLSFPQDMVVGSYPQKNQWGMWTSIPVTKEDNGVMRPIGTVLEDGTALIQGDHLGGGFMCLKRGILERFKEHFKDKIYQDSSADPADPERVYTEFWSCERHGGLRYGEDRAFAMHLKEMGEQWYIYPNVHFGHYGVQGWQGNYDKWLRGERKAQDPNIQKIT